MNESDIEFQNVDYEEVMKYLAVQLTKDEVKEMKIEDVLPSKTRGKNRKVGVAFLDTDKYPDKSDKWSWAGKREATREEKRRMLARTIGIMIKLVMNNHVYQFNGKTYKQRKGGPIGLLLTGTLSRVVMLEWDRLYLLKLVDMGLDPLSYFRYVDDQGICTWAVPEGSEIKEGKLEVNTIEGAKKEEPDERTARIFREVANGIMPMIQLEEDFQSKHDRKRIPVLDLEVWVAANRIHHTFYRKPMASKEVVANRSALDKKTKHNILIEEGMRRQRHISRREEESERDRNREEFLLDLRESGYPEGYRHRVMDQVEGKMRKEVEEHEKWREDRKKGRPLYKTGKEREEKKKEGGKGASAKEGWYKQGGYTSVLWVPATPEGELVERLKRKLEKTTAPEGTKMRLVQRGGKLSSRELTSGGKSQKGNCRREKCQPCEEGGEEEGSKGACYKGGIGYSGICSRCPEEDREKGIEEGKERQGLYIGESYRTLFRRTDDHFSAYVKKAEKSWMWQHAVAEHGGEIRGNGRRDYNFKVTGTFRDPTTRIADECVRLYREEKGLREAIGGTGKLMILNEKDEFYSSKIVKVNFVQL
jgi:hypothetical protein